ncbi:unnamed protein product [Ilex paraguariensis]|uniref:Uncharacterized protein n=1 Tax=Ilex paraguariensis TaxID=185542 RepID=A0ABC8T0A0_9AQUA
MISSSNGICVRGPGSRGLSPLCSAMSHGRGVRGDRAEKLEAYAPKRIGLGPYHHFRLDLYQMERKKLVAAEKVLKPDQIVNFQQLVVNKLVELEPTVRACYGDYLDLDGDTLAWIWAIDGLFLHYYLGYWNPSFDSSVCTTRLTLYKVI